MLFYLIKRRFMLMTSMFFEFKNMPSRLYIKNYISKTEFTIVNILEFKYLIKKRKKKKIIPLIELFLLQLYNLVES